MALILNIETSTPICSVALGKDGVCIAEKQDNSGQNHAKLLTVLIEQVLIEAKLTMADLDAIAISKGPGSYTGLRIGTSVAKGIAYAREIPLIAINTLQALANNASLPPNTLRCPMIDARRMEVYCQIFDSKLQPLDEVEAKILDENSFETLLFEKTIAFFGDGAEKFSKICKSGNAYFYGSIIPLAAQMISLSQEAYDTKDFANIAYFTPFYLKKFQVTVSKKKVF